MTEIESRAKPLMGIRAISFESRHAKTMGELLKLQGADVFSAPSMKEVPLESNTHLIDFSKRLMTGQIDALVLLTGVGTRALIKILEKAYSLEAIIKQLNQMLILPRGPKPIRVLKEMNVSYALEVPEPNTWKQLIEAMDQNKLDLSDRKVAIQEYGIKNAELDLALKARGAITESVTVYAWVLPDDVVPLQTAIHRIVKRDVDTVFFTTAAQIHHVALMARQMGVWIAVKEALSSIPICSIGPDCTEAIESYGLHARLQSSQGKMAVLCQEAGQKLPALLSKSDCSPCSVEVKNAILSLMSQEDEAMNKDSQSIFLDACWGRPTPRTPIWIMRQAGRYMPYYRDVRGQKGFLQMCKSPEIAADLTLYAQKVLDVDAAIIFADILLIVEAMGLGLEYVVGDGPKILRPLARTSDIESLDVSTAARQSLQYVHRAIRITRDTLNRDKALIGFAGAPFTIASYMIEGGSASTFEKTLAFMRQDKARWLDLMRTINTLTLGYLTDQVRAGAQALQLFDSWAGVLSTDDYQEYVMAPTRELVQDLNTLKVPTIYFATKSAHLLPSISGLGSRVIGVDHHIRLDEAWKQIGYDKAIQGNLDNQQLVTASQELVWRQAQEILNQAGTRPGHIFNLGHGVLPQTSMQRVIDLVAFVKDQSAKIRKA